MAITPFAQMQQAFAQQKFVGISGRQFTDTNGKPLFLKGINLGNWLLPEGYMFKFESASSPRRIETVLHELVGEERARQFWRTYRDRYITSADIRFIKSAGYNHVRIPFNYRLFVTEGDQPMLQGPGYELLQRVVDWCREAGLYVMLDMHGAPGGQTGDNIDDSFGYPFLFDSPEAQQLTIGVWRKLAAQFHEDKIIIGYDLLNEPIAHFHDTDRLNPKLEPLYKQITAAIREVDANHLIFLGGSQWNSNFSIFGPPFDDKLVYNFHAYWMKVEQKAIQKFIDFSAKFNVPLWMSESGENTDEWITDFRTLLEKNDVSWCFWPYKKLDATSCPVSISKPAMWDSIVTYANLPRANFAEIRKNRPSPQVISRALDEYLENLPFDKCRINDGYLKALGLK
jgi:aryl-phospho-beta-D-glucosidase BglC (GH1 family)